MRIINTHVYGIEDAIRASGYPMRTEVSYQPINEKDIDRAKRLARNPAGTGHNSFLKGIIVTADVTAPQYWWKQWQRYHFHDIVSSQSTMHRILQMDIEKQCNEYVDIVIIQTLQAYIDAYNRQPSKDLFQRIVSNIPSGLELTAETVTNYLQLKTIHQQRHNHKLEEWHIYCDWIKSLPYAEEFIIDRTIKEATP